VHDAASACREAVSGRAQRREVVVTLDSERCGEMQPNELL